jgi:hypothetical protein
LFLLVMGGFALYSFPALGADQDGYETGRERLTQSADSEKDKTSGRDQPSNGDAARRRSGPTRTGDLLNLAEAHGIHVQIDTGLQRSTGDALNLIDVKLTGSYRAIRAWLLDVCQVSPELLIRTARFRRGAADGEARAEVVFQDPRL